MYEEFTVEMETGEIKNITPEVKRIVEKSGISEGICMVFVLGSTGAVFVNEDDPRLLDDVSELMEKLVPPGIQRHPENGHSHLRALLIGPSVCLPVKNGSLELGTWQEIFVYNADTRYRERRIAVVVR
ncbi:MAG: YjbQ family protein [Candidatus Micrarchaeota archaeon]|nr:YjbQ family protein [Candidatus Micrarchaeota archaeon]